MGKKSLTRVELLETTLHEVETCVNSRHLTFVGDGLDPGSHLTPCHFLLGRPCGFKPTIGSENPVIGPCDRVRMHKLRRQLLERFLSRWVNEYLCSLPPCEGAAVNKGGIQVGSIVLIRGEGTSEGTRRLQWPLGIVHVVYPGRDGLVRSVQMKTAKGLLTRPIQRVHNLEIIESLNVPSR